jgi:hypothetical protein
LLCRVKLITGTNTSCMGETLSLYFGFPALRLAASKVRPVRQFRLGETSPGFLSGFES